MPNSRLLSRLCWMRRAEGEKVVAAIMVEPIPTDEDGVRERLPDLSWTTMTQIAETMLGERN